MFGLGLVSAESVTEPPGRRKVVEKLHPRNLFYFQAGKREREKQNIHFKYICCLNFVISIFFSTRRKSILDA